MVARCPRFRILPGPWIAPTSSSLRSGRTPSGARCGSSPSGVPRSGWPPPGGWRSGHWYHGGAEIAPAAWRRRAHRVKDRLVLRGSGQRFHHAVEVEGARLLARRKFTEALQPPSDVGTGGRGHEHALGPPLTVAHGFILGALEGIAAQGSQHGRAAVLAWLRPDVRSLGVLFQEGGLPILVAHGGDASVVGPLKEILSWPLGLTLECGHEVVAVEVDLEGLVADSLALQQFVLQVGLAGRREERLAHVFVRADLVVDGAPLDYAPPPDRGRYA